MLLGDATEDDIHDRIAIEKATVFVLPNGHSLENINGCAGDTLSCLPDSPEDSSPEGRDSYGLAAYSTGNWNKTVSMQDLRRLFQSMSVV